MCRGVRKNEAVAVVEGVGRGGGGAGWVLGGGGVQVKR